MMNNFKENLYKSILKGQDFERLNIYCSSGRSKNFVCKTFRIIFDSETVESGAKTQEQKKISKTFVHAMKKLIFLRISLK